MIQQDIDKLASLELLQRAMDCNSNGIAELLIESAWRLDNTVPVEDYKRIWLNNFLEKVATERGINEYE